MQVIGVPRARGVTRITGCTDPAHRPVDGRPAGLEDVMHAENSDGLGPSKGPGASLRHAEIEVQELSLP